MTTEELVIAKIRELNPDEQQQVWEFTNALSKPKPAASANFERHFGALPLENGTSIDNESIDADLAAEISPVGKKLRELRAEIVESGMPLLNREELDREIAERRGGFYIDDRES